MSGAVGAMIEPWPSSSIFFFPCFQSGVCLFSNIKLFCRIISINILPNHLFSFILFTFHEVFNVFFVYITQIFSSDFKGLKTFKSRVPSLMFYMILNIFFYFCFYIDILTILVSQNLINKFFLVLLKKSCECNVFYCVIYYFVQPALNYIII